jgi:hypothetical protein
MDSTTKKQQLGSVSSQGSASSLSLVKQLESVSLQGSSGSLIPVKQSESVTLRGSIGSLTPITSSSFRQIRKVVGTKIPTSRQGGVILLNQQCRSNLFVFDIPRKTIIRKTRKEFNEQVGPVVVINKIFKIKIINGNRKEIDCYRQLFGSRIPEFTGESLFSTVSGLFKTGSRLARISYSIATQESSVQTNALLLDATSLILQHSAGTFNNWTPSYFLGFIARIYSIFIRTKDLMKEPSLSAESLDSMILLTSAIGLPDQIFKILRNLNLLTSKKIGDHPGLFLDFIQQISTYFLTIINKMVWLPEKVTKFLNTVFSFGAYQTLLYELRSALASWEKDKRIMISKEFRIKINDIKKRLDDHPDTVDKMRNNMRFKQEYASFERMVKGAKAYESCSRQEPVFIVLEGPPGVKKTKALLQVIKLLNRSTYAHIVKGTEDGKDHYDGYNNEEVFVMDDVGQQSLSQWRTVINMVSAMKMPLECAALDLKDTKYFDSKFLLVTTNKFSDIHGLTKSDGISDIKALWRRAHVIKFVDENHAEYHRFDIYRNEWVREVIGGIPFAHSVRGDTTRIACWITALTEKLEDYYKDILENIELTDSQIEICRDVVDEFKNPFQDAVNLNGEALETMTLIVSEASSYIKQNLNILLDFIIDNISISNCLYSTVVGLCCYGIYSGAMALFGSNAEKEEQENGNLQILNEWTSKAKHKNQRVSLTPLGFMISESIAGTCVSAVAKQVKIVKILTNSDEFEISHCFVTGTFVLLPAHVVYNSKQKLILYNSQEDFIQERRALDCCKFEIVLEDRLHDVAVLKLPLLNQSPYKDLSHLLKYKGVTAKQMHFVWSGDPVALDGIVKPFQETPKYLTKYGYVEPGNVLTYEMASKGFCGSLIVDENAGIVGFHVAGDGDKWGIAKIFSQSLLAKIQQALKTEFSYDEIELKEVEDGQFSGMVAKTNLVSDGPSKTHLRPSKLSDLYPETKSPANLRALGPKTVKLRAKRVHKVVTTIPKEELDFMEKFLLHIIPNFSPISEEMVIRGNEDLASINKDSVSGMDFPLEKKNYFDFEEGVCKDNIKESLRLYREQAQTMYPSTTTQHHTLKDELRLMHKVDKPRTFGIDSLTTQFEMKRLMGDLFVKLKKNRWHNQLAIGINPYEDWPAIYDRLTKCEIVWDGDIGEYDASVSPEIQDLLNSIVLKKFVGSDFDKRILSRVLDLSVRSWVVAGNVKMYKTHGILSGMWITNLFNSLINRCYTAGWYYRMHKSKYGWTKIAHEHFAGDPEINKSSLPKRIEPTVVDFMETIVDFVQGDDKLNGVTKETDIYNAITMKEYYERCGMTFTDGEKGEIKEKGKKIEDCVFLKRKFNFHNQLGQVVGPLNLETLTNMLRWYSDDNDEDLILQDKMNVFQREMYLHGNVGKFHVDKLQDYCKKNKISFVRIPDNYLRYAFEITPDYLYELTKQTLNKNY